MRVAIVLLLLATSSARAEQAASRPAPACKVGGPILVQIDHKTKGNGSSLGIHTPGTTKLVVRTNGSWTHESSTATAPTATKQGCLPAQTLRLVRSAIYGATWKTRRAQATCAGISAEYTEYRVGRRLVLTRTLCDGLVLDKKTERALEVIDTHLEALDDDTASP